MGENELEGSESIAASNRKLHLQKLTP